MNKEKCIMSDNHPYWINFRFNGSKRHEIYFGGKEMNNYAEDCIHLKACRRICKYHKINNRGCTEDYCTAYQNIDDFMEEYDLYTRSEIEKVMNGAVNDGNSGYHSGDIIISDYINR